MKTHAPAHSNEEDFLEIVSGPAREQCTWQVIESPGVAESPESADRDPARSSGFAKSQN